MEKTCRQIVACQNDAEATRIYEDRFGPGVLQYGGSSGGKTPLKNRIWRKLMHSKLVFLTIIVTLFIISFYARFYDPSQYVSALHFWNNTEIKTMLIQKMARMLHISKDTAEDTWRHFKNMNIYTYIDKLYQTFRGNIKQITSFITSHGRMILSMLLSFSTTTSQNPQVNPFELFQISPLIYNEKEIEEKIHTLAQQFQSNPQLLELIHKGKEMVATEEKFHEAREKWFGEQQPKRANLFHTYGSTMLIVIPILYNIYHILKPRKSDAA